MELHLDQADGQGEMLFYELFPGLLLAYVIINAPEWPTVQTDAWRPLLLNYCIRGRCELLLDDNTYIYLQDGDIALSSQSAQDKFLYPRNIYEGIELYCDIELLKKNAAFIHEEFDIDMTAIEEAYCSGGKTSIVGADPETACLLKRIWGLYGHPSLFSLRIGALELLHLLSRREGRRSPQTRTFYTNAQVEIAKKTQQILTGDLRHHYPIRELAKRFSISETSLKNYFRGVYGQNISTYVRELRLDTAADLLSETTMSIADIATEIGYANQGKFAAAFKTQFGTTPLQYRKLQAIRGD